MRADQKLVRFSLRGLVLAMCVLAVFFAALHWSTELWMQAAVILTIGVLLATLLWSLCRRTADRTYWLGFQLAGWCWLVLSLAPTLDTAIGGKLLTSKFVEFCHARLPVNQRRAAMVEWGGTWWPATILQFDGAKYQIHYVGYGSEWDEWVGPPRIRAGNVEYFRRIGAAMATLLAALAGGVFARYAARAHRISIAAPLLALTGLTITAAVAAMARPIEIVANLALTLAIVTWLATAIAAFCAASESRSFWIGFAVLGTACVILMFTPLSGILGSRLPTTSLLLAAHELLHPDHGAVGIYPAANNLPPGFVAMAPVGSLSKSFQLVVVAPTFAEVFVQSGHVLLTMLIALVGGLAARAIATFGDSKSAQPERGETKPARPV